MKRMLVATMVLGLLATAAPAVITHTVTPIGNFTLGLGSGPIIDVYTIRYDAGAERLLGALVIDVGTIAGLGGGDPFQAAWVSVGKPFTVNLTPTYDDANTWLTPPDTSKAFESDSYFMPPGISTWVPAIVVPAELPANNGSIYNAANNTTDYKAGVGGLTIAVAVPVAYRTQSMDVLHIGVSRSGYSGAGVWIKDGSADELGVVTEWTYFIPAIPEPATLSLLALGALCLIRRRRA